MKTKLKKLSWAMVILLPLFLHCEGEGVDIPHCTIPLNLELVQSWDSIIGATTGSILVEVTRGNGGYEYSINGGSYQASGDFEDLAGGDYVISARDRQGCTAELTITIAEVEVPSFANDIMPIIENFCSIRSCHATTQGTRFEMLDYNDVAAEVGSIRTRVINRTMPPRFRPSLSESQIGAIVNWIDGGAPNN